MPNAVGLVQSFLSSVASALLGVARTQHHSKDFSLEVVRADDLLILTFDFYNVSLVPAAGPAPARLGRRGAGDVFMVARFPSQSFGEQAFFEDSDPLLPPPIASRIAGPSQIVLRIPDSLLPLDLTLETLLTGLEQGQPLVQRTIRQPPPVPVMGANADFNGPRGQYTGIEAPYRLVVSHGANSRWDHALAAVTNASGQRTELWHTRLTANGVARAVWSPDAAPLASPPPPDDLPFRMSLQRLDRHNIVHSTANSSLAGNAPVAVDRFMLSSQGAWLTLHGQWQTQLDLVEWRHILTGGRDQFARIVEEGRLFHFGHRAVTVEITERKLATVKQGLLEGTPGAYLLKRLYVVVRQPTKVFSHRHVPFRTVTIKSLTTPDLDDPKKSELIPSQGKLAFWPIVLGGGPAQDFQFHIVATDWEGREIEFHTPLAFIAKSIAEQQPGTIAGVVNDFNALPESNARRSRPMGGQSIAFAPAEKPGDTSMETAEMLFGALNATGSPLFLPAMAKAKVDVPAVRHLTGNPALSTIELDPQFVAFSGSAIGNMGDVFARLSGSATPVAFPPEKTGGLVAPDFGISGLSRAYGPVGGDASKFAAGEFKPADVFKGVKLLGCIDLAGIIADLVNVTPTVAGPAIPGLQTIRTTKPLLGDVFETTYVWNLDAGKLINQLNLPTPGPFAPAASAIFSLSTVVDAPLSGQPPHFTVTGELRDFSLTLLPAPKEAGIVALHFKSITFKAGSDTKVDVSVIFGKFEFIGPLSFVNKLQEFIPLDGFDDPPYLDLVLPPQEHPGVNVGFTLGIPTIGIGIFTLQNISFGAGFYLPLIGEPANLRLAFCERHQPFILTVSLFGGGGFFAIDIGLQGVRQIEAALEFGAAIALNLGVASGSACVMGGVYYQKSTGGFALSAYFRAAGSLSVLGIITVSVEFYVGLNYESDKGAAHGGKLWGQASVTVKVKIAFFSKSVSISIEREFAGSDPTFALMLAPADWSLYCEAFADYPA